MGQMFADLLSAGLLVILVPLLVYIVLAIVLKWGTP